MILTISINISPYGFSKWKILSLDRKEVEYRLGVSLDIESYLIEAYIRVERIFYFLAHT